MELIGTNLGMLMALRMAGRELGDCPNIEMKTMGGRKSGSPTRRNKDGSFRPIRSRSCPGSLDDNNRRKAGETRRLWRRSLNGF